MSNKYPLVLGESGFEELKPNDYLPIDAGGTGAVSSEQARANIGAVNDVEVVNTINTQVPPMITDEAINVVNNIVPPMITDEATNVVNQVIQNETNNGNILSTQDVINLIDIHGGGGTNIYNIVFLPFWKKDSTKKCIRLENGVLNLVKKNGNTKQINLGCA